MVRTAPDPAEPRRRRLRRPWFRVRAVSGADVISLRQISPRERLRVTAPSMITTVNLGLGFSGALLAFNSEFTLAAGLMTVAIVADMADGAVARAVGATSPFGIQLDSMADLISFGMAPAVLIYTWALPERPILAWLGAFLWLACAAFRSGAITTTIAVPVHVHGPDHGEEITSTITITSTVPALVVISTVMALDSPGSQHGRDLVYPVLIGVLPALLMVSTVRFRSFRNLLNPRTPQALVTTLVLGAAALAGLATAPAYTLMVLAYSYVLTAPLGALTSGLRRRVFGADAVAPPKPKSISVFLAPELVPDEVDSRPL